MQLLSELGPLDEKSMVQLIAVIVEHTIHPIRISQNSRAKSHTKPIEVVKHLVDGKLTPTTFVVVMRPSLNNSGWTARTSKTKLKFLSPKIRNWT